jgi:hypothetical protein
MGLTPIARPKIARLVERQTREFEKLLAIRPWGFESLVAHQIWIVGTAATAPGRNPGGAGPLRRFESFTIHQMWACGEMADTAGSEPAGR